MNNIYSLGLYEKAIPSEFGFEEKLKIAKDGGFDRLEISIDESDARLARLDWSYAQKKELKTLIEESGVCIRTMCLSGHRKYPMGAHSEETREKSMEIMKKAIDFCQEIGISIIQLAGYDVYYEDGDETTRKYFEENLKIAAKYAAARGVMLGFETMETPFMDTVEKAMHYVNVVNSPWLGVYPDIGNLKNAAVLYGHNVADDMNKGAGHIVAVHLKETMPGIYRDMRFGDEKGHTEYESCIKAAIDMGCCMFTGEFWYQKGQNYMDEILHANRFLREKIEKCL